ncbi:unnamed protein product, partial [marine sediment metagenome]
MLAAPPNGLGAQLTRHSACQPATDASLISHVSSVV